jgi:hypothetical protein
MYYSGRGGSSCKPLIFIGPVDWPSIYQENHHGKWVQRKASRCRNGGRRVFIASISGYYG